MTTNLPTWRECYFAERNFVSDNWDGYFEVYDRCFGRYRSKPAPIYLEIGCQNGGSLETARAYFGEGAKIYGIDIDSACDKLNNVPGLDRVFIGNAADPAFLTEALNAIGAPDIILDDSSHRPHDVVTTFLAAFPLLADGGMYLVEGYLLRLLRDAPEALSRADVNRVLRRAQCAALTQHVGAGAASHTLP